MYDVNKIRIKIKKKQKTKKVLSTKKLKQILPTKKDFITCSKLIINKHVGSPIKSDNVHFANNEQASLVFFIAHAKQNLIKLKLYSNQSIQAVNNISESGM